MKKRFSLIGLLCGVLILSMLCGCGSKDQNKDNSNALDNNVTEMSATEKTESDSVFTKRFVNDFSDGYAWITLSNESRDFYKFVCINANGEKQFVLNDLIEIEHSNGIGDFKDGYAVVVDKSDVSYIIDSSGKILSSSKDIGYDKVICYDDGYFLVEKCNNNLHEVSYVYSVIDGDGNTLIKDWKVLDKAGAECFEYHACDVFRFNSECINAKTQKKFALEKVKHLFYYNENMTFISGENWGGKDQIIDNEGNIVQPDLDNYIVDYLNINYFNKPIVNNSLICEKTNDDSLYKLDVNTGEISEIYHCGNGIKASVRGLSENGVLLNVIDDKTNWIVFIDYNGNEKFTPIDTFDGEVKSLSCDRIIANVRGDKGDSYNVYDLKGNRISFEGTDTKLVKYEFNSDLVIVKTKNNNGEEYYNYMDINGKLLFTDSTTEL